MPTLPGRLMRLAALAGLALGAVGLANGQPAAAQTSSTIVVLDQSNSMNGRLAGDTTAKHVVMREAIRRALSQAAPGAQIGLAAFGHRRGGDCSDTEVIQPPTTDHAATLAALERMQPKGFSPVALALRTAARALPPGVKSSIVLVLDDLASCRSEDPCRAAADIHRDAPALAIHVVGLGLKATDAQVMACVAQTTNGQLIEAQDGEGAAAAFARAMQLASVTPQPQPVPTRATPMAATQGAIAPPAKQRAPGPPPAPALEPGVNLSAHLADGRPALTQLVRWRIVRDGEPDKDAAPVAQGYAPTLAIVLPNGRYVAVARAGLVSGRIAFEVTSPAPMAVKVPLDAAQLALAVSLAKGGAPWRRALVSLTPSGTPDKPIWLAQTGAEDLVVPAGSYLVAAEDGLVRATAAVSVAAGERREVELAFGAGHLVVDVASQTGEAGSDPIQLVVEEDDPDRPTGKREILRTAVPRLDATLRAGSYQITARRSGAEVRERVTIRAGDDSAYSLALAATRVRLSGGGAGGNVGKGVAVAYKIERLDGAPRVISRGGEGDQVLELSPGRYRLEARLGAQNAIVQREVELRAGPEQRVDLAAPAAAVRLKLLSPEARLFFGEVFWQVRGEGGEIIWQTGAQEPSLILAPGRYVATVDVRDRQLEKSFEVRTGETRTIEVGGS